MFPLPFTLQGGQVIGVKTQYSTNSRAQTYTHRHTPLGHTQTPRQCTQVHTVQTVEEAGVKLAPLSTQTFTPENTLH